MRIQLAYEIRGNEPPGSILSDGGDGGVRTSSCSSSHLATETVQPCHPLAWPIKSGKPSMVPTSTLLRGYGVKGSRILLDVFASALWTDDLVLVVFGEGQD